MIGVRRAGGMLALAAALAAPMACASGSQPYARGASPAEAAVDSGADLVPAGYGSLRQDDISMQVRLPAVLVRATPLAEPIIRLLSPDSYQALRGLREGQRDAIARTATRLGVHHPSLWYLSFFGLEPGARFTARDVDIVSGGRDFRPLDVLPLSAGFGSERVEQRQVESAIYVFDEGINPSQPLSLTVDGVPATSWAAVIPVMERERALIRARAARP